MDQCVAVYKIVAFAERWGLPAHRTGASLSHTRLSLAVATLSAGSLLGLGSAVAQSVGPQINEPDDVPGNRVIPEYQPIGYEWAGLDIFPSVTFGAKADSNVFARDDARRGDMIAQVTPQLRISHVNRFTDLVLEASARSSNYAVLTDQDSFEYKAEGKFTYGTQGPNSLSLDAGYRREVVQRGTVEADIVAGKPAIRRVLFGSVTGRKQLNRVSFDGQIIALKMRYNDIAEGADVSMDQSFRNAERWGLQGVATYELSGRTAVSLGGSYDHLNYRPSPALIDRDAQNTTVTIGVRYELSRVLFAQLSLGVRHYDFRNPALQDITGLAISGHLRYFPTRLLAIRGKIEQTNTTSPYDLVGAVTLTTAEVATEYEMRRDLSWMAATSYMIEDYGKQPYSGRRFEASGGPRFRFNRWLRADATLGYAKRTARGAAPFQPFTQVYAMATVTFSR